MPTSADAAEMFKQRVQSEYDEAYRSTIANPPSPDRAFFEGRRSALAWVLSEMPAESPRLPATPCTRIGELERERDEEKARVGVLEGDLAKAAEILQTMIPIGAVKAIGLREVPAGVETMARMIVQRDSAVRVLEATVKQLEGELAEQHIDEHGNVWTRPTAWAYCQACEARTKWQELCKAAERERDALIADLAALQERCERAEAENAHLKRLLIRSQCGCVGADCRHHGAFIAEEVELWQSIVIEGDFPEYKHDWPALTPAPAEEAKPERPPMLLAECVAGGPLRWWTYRSWDRTWECDVIECSSSQLCDIDRDASDDRALELFDADMASVTGKGE